MTISILQQTFHVMDKKFKTLSTILLIFLSHINAIFLTQHHYMLQRDQVMRVVFLQKWFYAIKLNYH